MGAHDRIVAVGSFEELRDFGHAAIDDTFADAVVCPGFIEQHLHPILGATTLVTEVIGRSSAGTPGQSPAHIFRETLIPNFFALVGLFVPASIRALY